MGGGEVGRGWACGFWEGEDGRVAGGGGDTGCIVKEASYACSYEQ